MTGLYNCLKVLPLTIRQLIQKWNVYYMQLQKSKVNYYLLKADSEGFQL